MSTKQIAPIQNGAPVSYRLTDDQIQTLTRAGVIPSGTPADQIGVFAQVCKERGLSPFSKEIHLVKYNSNDGPRYSIITGIDGFRKIAARTGQLAGCDDPRFDLRSNGAYATAAELKMDNRLPTSCTITVYRLIAGQRVPFTATCLFDEFASKYNGKPSKWADMPFHMIAKCAEAFALKKGFDDELTGINVEEEMAAMEGSNGGTITTLEQDMERVELLDMIRSQFDNFKTLADLRAYYNRNPAWAGDSEIIDLFNDYAVAKGWK